MQFSESVFAPFGVLSPTMLRLKVMFQHCKEEKDWDEKLPAEISAKFKQRLLKATKVPNIKIERCYTKNKEILLLGFCDASKIGYAAFIYQSRSIKMIAAKKRVVRLTKQSIPRLELLGALFLSRLMKTVKEH